MLGDDDDDLVPVKDDFVNAGMSSVGVDPEHVFNQQVSSLQTTTLIMKLFYSKYQYSKEGSRRKVVQRRARGPLPSPPRGERRAEEACVQTGGQDKKAGTAHCFHRICESFKLPLNQGILIQLFEPNLNLNIKRHCIANMGKMESVCARRRSSSGCCRTRSGWR